DEGLAAGHVAGSEDAGNVRHFVGVSGDVTAFIDGDAELGEHPVAFGTEKSHREEHEIGINREFGSGDLMHVSALEFNVDAMKLFDVPVTAGEAFCQNAVLARAAFFVRRGGTEDVRPIGPRIVQSAIQRRLWKQFKLDYGTRALPVHCPKAVRARVTATNDDDVLVLDRKSTRLNSSHEWISYAVFCLK